MRMTSIISICFLFLFSPFLPGSLLFSQTEGSPIGIPGDELPSDEDESEEKAVRASYSAHYMGQGFSLFIPVTRQNVLYGFGFGGSFVYENYALNRLFSPHQALPGILFGLTATVFIMGPSEQYEARFDDCTVASIGLYTGYQFIVPLSRTVDFSPSFHTGVRYYASFHFFEDTVWFLHHPIVTGGVRLNFIVRKFFSFSLRTEYELFIEPEPVHSIQLSLETGIFL